MIMQNNKKEESLKDIELTKEEVDEALRIFEDSSENDIRTDENNPKNRVEKFIREKEKVDASIYESESETVVNEEISVDNKENNIKYNKKNLENISKNVNEINNKVEDVLKSLKSDNGSKAVLKIEELNLNVPTIEVQAGEFMKLAKEKIKDIQDNKELINGLISTVLILCKKVIDNRNNIKKLSEAFEIDKENKINIAISGEKGKNREEKEYIKNKRMNELKKKMSI